MKTHLVICRYRMLNDHFRNDSMKMDYLHFEVIKTKLVMVNYATDERRQYISNDFIRSKIVSLKVSGYELRDNVVLNEDEIFEINKRIEQV